MTDIIAFGETMALLSSAKRGPLRHASALSLGVAGAESNVLIGATRLGASTRWVGRVGDDEFGRLVEMTIRGQGVETRAIIDPSRRTGLMAKEQRAAGMTKVLYYRAESAGSALEVADIVEEEISSARVVHLSGITAALSEIAREALFHCVDIAKATGTLVSFDLNYRAALWSLEEAAPVLRDLVALSDVIFATEDEARIIVDGAGSLELAAALAKLGPSQIVVKRGSQGAFALVHGVEFTVPAEKVTEVDPVGAGDAFTAGYLAELCAGADVEARLRTAAQCGAFAVTVDGDWEGAPSRSDLLLLDGNAGDVIR